MRVLILIATMMPLLAVADLPEHESTHYYRLEECGTVQMLLIVPPDESPTLAGYGLTDRDTQEVLDHRREAIDNGYAVQVEMNPKCQDM